MNSTLSLSPGVGVGVKARSRTAEKWTVVIPASDGLLGAEDCGEEAEVSSRVCDRMREFRCQNKETPEIDDAGRSLECRLPRHKKGKSRC
jgi:hypothetical protein